MALSAIPDELHITVQQQVRKCGKPCKTCSQGGGHGPYWYAYWRVGTVRSTYIGKELPTSIIDRLEQQKAAAVPIVDLVQQQKQEEVAVACFEPSRNRTRSYASCRPGIPEEVFQGASGCFTGLR